MRSNDLRPALGLRWKLRFAACLGLGLAGALPALSPAGCTRPAGGGEVVVYCALDKNFAGPVLQEFEKRSGIKVVGQFDLEASKTVGLFTKIKEEMPRPRCDVFWNNETMLTVCLKNLGALQPYRSPSAEAIPAAFKDPEGYWTGFASRARVLIVNSKLLADRSEWPRSYQDLTDPKWASRCGMARPLTGTTATHGTVLFQVLGEECAKDFFHKLLVNDVHMLPGNAHVMRQVRDGQLVFGLTDSDDFNVARADGYPVGAVYPDQGEGEVGTLVIPNSVAMIAGCPNPDNAKKLIDYLLTSEVEEKLAFCGSAQIPLRPVVRRPDYVKVPGVDFSAMEVDFERAAAEYEKTKEYLNALFTR